MTASTLPDKAAVLAAFKDTPEGRVVVHAFDKLGSTSGWLGARRSKVQTQLENGCAEICVTDWQQAGVGRRGKTWQTRPGNITFSLLQRLHSPAQNLLGLSLVTGIAVSDVLEETLGLKAMLKWPNDVIHQDRKLGGLLTELVAGNGERAEARPFTDVITGIGLNVFHDDAVSAMGLGATSLHAAGFEIDQHERDRIVGRMTMKACTRLRALLGKRFFCTKCSMSCGLSRWVIDCRPAWWCPMWQGTACYLTYRPGVVLGWALDLYRWHQLPSLKD